MADRTDNEGTEPLAGKNTELLEKLSGLARDGRRPLQEFLQLSGEAGEDDLRAVRSFLFDLYCQIYGIAPGSEQEAGVRFKLLQELSKGESVEEITNLFIGNLYLTEIQGRGGIAPERAPAAPAQQPPPRGLAERARLYIEDSYTERISLGTIAQELGISKEHLSRVFKKKYGRTVTEEVHAVRIEVAKRLMSRDGCSLKQICYETGYQSYNDFYRNFRKVTGQSPKDFLGE
jgi:AraC-like DNA-binding protein